MHFRPIAVAALCAVSLAGCANGVTRISTPTHPSLDPEDELQFAARGGRSIPVEVRGAAFPIPSPAFAAAVAKIMDGANHGPPVHFTTTPSERDKLGYRVVMRFNGPPTERDEALCKGGDTRSVATAGETDLAAAFCLNDRLISGAFGAVDGATGTDDPRFRDLVRGVVGEISRSGHELQDKGENAVPVP